MGEKACVAGKTSLSFALGKEDGKNSSWRGEGGSKKKKKTPAVIGGYTQVKKKGCFEERPKSRKVREIWPALLSAPSFPSSICSPELVQHCLSFLVFPVARASQFQSRGEGVHMEGPMGRGGSWPLPRSAGADSGASVT